MTSSSEKDQEIQMGIMLKTVNGKSVGTLGTGSVLGETE